VSQVVAIENEVIDTCIANTKAQLAKCEQKGKASLDKGFIGDQLHAHMGLLDKVTTFQKHATQEMQPELKKAEGIIRQHIATCEKLMEKLEPMAMAEKQGQGGNRQPDRLYRRDPGRQAVKPCQQRPQWPRVPSRPAGRAGCGRTKTGSTWGR